MTDPTTARRIADRLESTVTDDYVPVHCTCCGNFIAPCSPPAPPVPVLCARCAEETRHREQKR